MSSSALGFYMCSVVLAIFSNGHHYYRGRARSFNGKVITQAKLKYGDAFWNAYECFFLTLCFFLIWGQYIATADVRILAVNFVLSTCAL